MITALLFTLANCTQISVDGSKGLPKTTYKQEPVYSGPTNSVGTLTEGYVLNTESLIIVNSRLKALCIANKVCNEHGNIIPTPL